MIERVLHDNSIVAIIIRSDFKKEGIEFFTPNEFSQQLAYMNHPKGHVIKPHIHNMIVRSVLYTLETLYIKKGSVQVDFYTDDKKYIESCIIKTGDVILLASGGHGFTMLEPTEMIEVKQGPFSGEDDKQRFEGN
jgi:mannose-6-phosphate isomerase-like protein (cupin superfamily)